MIISIDYDETYTRDPIMWHEIIKLMISRGHTVYCVTARCEDNDGWKVKQDLEHFIHGIYFTCGKQKEKFMFDRGICVQVWIDDQPLSIVNKDMKEEWE